VGNYTQAISKYEYVLAFKPENVRALLGQADAKTWLWDFDGARNTLDKVLKNDSTNPRALTIQGNLHTLCGEFDDAREKFERALYLNLDNKREFDTWIGLTDAYIGKAHNAIIEKNETDASEYIKKAQNSHEKAKAIEATDLYLLNAWGDLTFVEAKLELLKENSTAAIEKFMNARNIFQDIIDDKTHGYFPDAMTSLADTYLELAELEDAPDYDRVEYYQKASENYNKVKEKTPNNHYAMTGIGFVLIEEERYDDAKKNFEQVLDTCKDDPYAKQGMNELRKKVSDRQLGNAT